MGTTTGRLGVTTYNAGDTAWSHTSGLETIDTNITNILKGKMFAAAVTSSSSAVNLTSLDSKGVGLLEFTSASGGNDLTTITNGTDEQFLFVRFTNASPADVIHGTGTDAITLRRAANWTPSQNDWLILWYDSNVWREVTSSSPSLDDSSITHQKLSLGSASGTGGSALSVLGSLNINATAGTKAFFPICYGAAGGGAILNNYGLYFGSSGASGTLSYSYQYVQGTPPWYVDGDMWGSFIFIDRDKSTGEIFQAHVAEDPPWYRGGSNPLNTNKLDPLAITYNGSPWLFLYEYGDGTVSHEPPPGREIVMVDLRSVDLEIEGFSKKREAGKALRTQATAMASSGGDLEEILALTKRAEELEASTPSPMHAFRARSKRAQLLGKNEWVDYLSNHPGILGASSQATKDGSNKPVKFGVKSVDDIITVVTAG